MTDPVFTTPPVFQPQPGPLLPHQVVQVSNETAANPAAVVDAVNGKKGRRGPRQAKPTNPPAAVEGTKKPRGRPKAVEATPARAASTMKLDFAVAIEALVGLTVDEAKLVQGVVLALQPFKAPERARILTAIQKVLG